MMVVVSKARFSLLSCAGLTRASRLGGHRASLSGMAGSSPAMTSERVFVRAAGVLQPPRFHKIPPHDTVVNRSLTISWANFAWAGVIMHRVRPTRVGSAAFGAHHFPYRFSVCFSAFRAPEPPHWTR
jgi:hypothetical protein